jgi:hypothetical protein
LLHIGQIPFSLFLLALFSLQPSTLHHAVPPLPFAVHTVPKHFSLLPLELLKVLVKIRLIVNSMFCLSISIHCFGLASHMLEAIISSWLTVIDIKYVSDTFVSQTMH